MPQIKEYTNTKIPQGNPYESTAYSLERYSRVNQESIERGASGLAKAAQTISDHEDRMQLSDWTTANSNRDRQLWEGYHATLNDPNASPDAAEKYLNEKVLPELDKNPLGDNQELRPNVAEKVQEVTARQKYDWTREAMTGQAKMDGERQQAAVNTQVNNSAAIVGPHPDMYGAQIAATDHAIETIVPAAQQAEAKFLAHQHLAKAAAEGIVSSTTAGIRSAMVDAAQLNVDGIDDPNFTPVDVAQAGAAKIAAAREQLKQFAGDLGADNAGQYNSRLEAAGANLSYEAQRINDGMISQARQQRAVASEMNSTKIQDDALNGQISFDEAVRRLSAPGSGIKGEDQRATISFLHQQIVQSSAEAKRAAAEQSKEQKAAHLADYTSLNNIALTGAPSAADVKNMIAEYNLTPGESKIVLSSLDYAKNVKITPFVKDKVDAYGVEAKQLFGLDAASLNGNPPDPTALATYNNYMGWLRDSVLNQQTPQEWLTTQATHIRDTARAMQAKLSPGGTNLDRYKAIINRNTQGPVKPTAPVPAPVPTGVDPKVWGVMTPQERAQWK